ncbi:MAG: hypothetical protein Q7S51_10855, partial [Gallionellaceae bacterium]|nr:hypothetical protein [Gallionellaceae bacterium]
EASAAAESMEEEANNLAQSVSVFKLHDEDGIPPVMEAPRATPAHATEVPHALTNSTTKGGGSAPSLPKNLQEGEWTEF